MANATLTIHSADWLEGSLSLGYEKFINDLEALQTIAELAAKTDGSVLKLALKHWPMCNWAGTSLSHNTRWSVIPPHFIRGCTTPLD